MWSVFQAILIRVSFDSAYAIPHRGDTVSVQHLSDGVPSQKSPDLSQTHPHGGETFPVWNLPKSIYSAKYFIRPYEDTHGREATPVSALQQGVCPEVSSHPTHQDTHGRETLRVWGVWHGIREQQCTWTSLQENPWRCLKSWMISYIGQECNMAIEIPWCLLEFEIPYLFFHFNIWIMHLVIFWTYIGHLTEVFRYCEDVDGGRDNGIMITCKAYNKLSNCLCI